MRVDTQGISFQLRHLLRLTACCSALTLGGMPLLAQGADATPPTSLSRVEPEAVGMSSARFGLLDTMLRQHVTDGHVAGLVAGVARHGRIVYLQSMGWQDIEADQAMREDSIFQIRSLSKSITSLAVMQLVEQGRLALEDPVARYIPSFADMQVFVNPDDPDNSPLRPPARAATIQDLLLNIGGLSHRDRALYQSRAVRSRADTLEQFVEKVAAVPLVGDPGSVWVYSESTTVLGRVIEIVTGQPFDVYLQENVLAPLRMTDTAFFVPPGKVDRLARIYQAPREGGPLRKQPDMDIPITQDPPLKEGSAGLVSTVPDYLRLLQMFLDGGTLDGERLLSPEGIAQMTRNHIPPALLPIGMSPQSRIQDRGWGYGYMVVIDAAKSPFSVNNGEFGWIGSLGTYAWADPETGTVAVLMMQVEPAGAYSVADTFKAIVAQTLTD
jgi:CubicO group peptidase (beta-lactamase class C family)